MTTIRNSRPGSRSPSLALIVLLLASFFAGLFGTGSPKVAKGDYWWTWPTYPYIRDVENMYAYRDMEFWWTPWSGGYSWSYGVYTYVQIASLGNYHDNWGTIVSGDNNTQNWYGYHYVNSSSGLQYWASSSGYKDNLNAIHVGTASCKASAICASAPFTAEGAYLGASVYNGQTSATCAVKMHPTAAYC